MDTLGLRERFEALNNIEELLSVAAPQYRDPEVYFTELISNEPNKNIAEKRLRVLEDIGIREAGEKAKMLSERLRRDRDNYLRECDWTQLPDTPLGSDIKKSYRKYRRYLRDLPTLIKQGNSTIDLMTYEEWKNWIEKVKHTPGFETYIP